MQIQGTPTYIPPSMEQDGTQPSLKSPEAPPLSPGTASAGMERPRAPSRESSVIQASYIPAAEISSNGELSSTELTTLARENLATVRLRCRKLISRVRSRAAEHLKTQRAKARAAGFEEGRRAGQAELEKFLSLDKAYAQTCRSAERDCLELSVSIASEIVAQDLAPNEELLAARIARATDELLDKRRLTIEVRPEALLGVSEALNHSNLASSSFEIQADDSLQTGMARLSTASGVLLLDWQRHLEVIRERLLERFSQQPGSNP